MTVWTTTPLTDLEDSGTGLTHSFRFDDAGPVTIYADVDKCASGVASIVVEAKPVTEIECVSPAYFNDPFVCEATCDSDPKTVQWSVSPGSALSEETLQSLGNSAISNATVETIDLVSADAVSSTGVTLSFSGDIESVPFDASSIEIKATDESAVLTVDTVTKSGNTVSLNLNASTQLDSTKNYQLKISNASIRQNLAIFT